MRDPEALLKVVWKLWMDTMKERDQQKAEVHRLHTQVREGGLPFRLTPWSGLVGTLPEPFVGPYDAKKYEPKFYD
jgi:hypothetical protein